jgi:hypothetical protein
MATPAIGEELVRYVTGLGDANPARNTGESATQSSPTDALPAISPLKVPSNCSFRT